MKIFLGTEAIAAGAATPGELRYRYRRLFPNVYVSRDREPSLTERTVAASLWSGRQAIITGGAAAAWHGSRWVDADVPIELIYDCKRPPSGIVTRNERIADDEYVVRGALSIANVQRTAFDLGRFLPPDRAIEQLDALANRTGVTADAIRPLLERYKGVRGTRRLRKALALMDAGAQSPKETWLRLLLIEKGLPPPTTQIPVYDESGWPFAYLDMGWKDLRLAVEYDGDHHRGRTQYQLDIQRLREIEQHDWMVVKVINEDEDDEIIERVKRARKLRERALRVMRQAS